MKNSVSQFLFGASQFFKTTPHASAYLEIFPKQHLQSLFYVKKELEKKEGETEEDVQKKSEERIEKINQTLQSFASNPSEEAQPDYPDPVVKIINEYQQLASDRASGVVPQEQLVSRQSNLNQSFNSYIDKNSAPLAGIAGVAVQAGVSKVTGSIASKVAGVVLGIANPAVGAIVGFLGKEVISRAITWIIKNRNRFLELFGGGLIVGGVALGGAVGTAMAVGGTGIGALGLIGEAGGISGAGAALGGALSTIAVGLTTAAIGAILVPIGIAIVVIPIIVALILFIINSGAYIVPPATSISGLPEAGTITTIFSPYIDIQKIASPAGPFKNSDLGGGLAIKYTVRIRPKKGALTNLKFENKCQAIKKNSLVNCDSPIPDKDKDKIPESLDPGNTFEFSYTTTYTSGNFEDSLVLDTFQVTADAFPEKTGAVAAASASIIIGNPPTACFDFADGWPGREKNMAIQAMAFLSANVPSYMARVCAGGKVTLHPTGGGEGWGYVPGTRDINFNLPGGFKNIKDAVYILAHESGHIFVQSYGAIYKKYVDTVWSPEATLICTYPLTNSVSESFPESIADYISDSPISPGIPPGILSFGCLGGRTFQEVYPNHWNFVHSNIINELIGWPNISVVK